MDESELPMLNDAIALRNLAFISSGMGTWAIDLFMNQCYIDDHARQLLGFPTDNISDVKDIWMHVQHADRKYLEIIRTRAFDPASGGVFETHLRTTDNSGRVRTILCKGKVHFNSEFSPTLFLGTVQTSDQAMPATDALTDTGFLNSITLERAGIGSFRFSMNNNHFEFSQTLIKLFTGVTNADAGRQDLIRTILPEDLAVREIAHQVGERTGKLEYQARVRWDDGSLHWISVSGTYDFDINHRPVQLTGVAFDITTAKNSERDLAESEERFRSLIEQAPIATCLFVGEDMVIKIANEMMIKVWGKGHSVINKPFGVAVPELEGQPFLQILDDIYKTGIPYEAKAAPVDLVIDGVMSTYYFDYIYKPIYDSKGDVFGIMNMATDVTEQVLARKKLDENQRVLDMAMEVADLGSFKVDLTTNTATNSQSVVDWFGSSGHQEDLQSIFSRIHERDRDRVMTAIQDSIVSPDVPTHDITYRVVSPKDNILRHLRSVGKVYYANGSPSFISGILQDVTQQVLSRRTMEKTQQRLRSILENAPAGIALFVGRELVIDFPNQMFIDILGKGPDIVGKSLSEVLPELVSERQGFIELLQNVYDSGTTFQSFGTKAMIDIDGVLTDKYFNITFTPLVDSDNKVYAILDMSVDVTETVLAKNRIDEAEATLRSAINVANLDTWTIDTEQQTITFSDRFRSWTYSDHIEMPLNEFSDMVHQDDRELVKRVLDIILQTDHDVLNIEYRLTNHINEQTRTIHTQGRKVSLGNMVRVIGISQDITQQKNQQLTLENEVKRRTEQLAETNNVLARSNEELMHSNLVLEQYAFVASHDLREPLRKIRLFVDQLVQFEAFSDREQGLLIKINRAADRMSMLITDLLAYSRLKDPNVLFGPVSLEEAIADALSQLDVLIEEKHAKILVDKLPVVTGIESQLTQLFFNIIGNALKFSRANVAPSIQVKGHEVDGPIAARLVPHHRINARYYQISILDNGIGIRAEYTKQIFEIFKRLHSPTRFAGSGIGLAMCKRIVETHGGAIFAESDGETESSFHILLPVD